MRSPIPVPTRRQALEQVKRDPTYRGICHECGCTEPNPCITGGEPCGWANHEQTLCDAPACIAASFQKLLNAATAEAKQNLCNAKAIVGQKLFEQIQRLDQDEVTVESMSIDIEGVVFRFSDGFKIGWKR